MTRRAAAHDYSRPGTYHITLHVAEGRGCPLGTVTGDPMAADGSPEAPRVELTPVGQMVEHELLTAIPARYPMVAVQDHVVMPDHLHALVVVTDMIISPSGKRLPLGQVIAGFKKGCNKRYWEMAGYGCGETASHAVADGFPVGTYKVPSNASSGRPPLFQEGYCDVMPVDVAQLETQRAYIRENPRSRLLRLSHRDQLTTQRGAIPTALTVNALTGYLRRECAPAQAGAILVSPRIAKGEQEILDEAVRHGFPVALVADNGFHERYHPSAERLDRCAAGRLLLVSPWRYRYRPKGEAITVAECKTLNCVAQALCHQADSWWKEKQGNGK